MMISRNGRKWWGILLLLGSSFSALAGNCNSANPRFFIVDSWLTGYVGGFFSTKEGRLHAAWEESKHRARVDTKIWGGLFVTDTNRRFWYRTGEFFSRLTYQLPQTLGGFGTAHYYNTIAGKVNRVEYAMGSTVFNLDVNWPGVALGSYILAKPVINAHPNNKMFQHEYGHYLQSKRMGIAYFVRVGLPAIMSRGDHDAHPVEIDCNREGFLYFNRYYPSFQHDSLYADTLGWNFHFNPFPDSVGNQVKSRANYVFQYVNYNSYTDSVSVERLKVRASFMDYASWILFPAPLIVGIVHAHRYNEVLVPKEEKQQVSSQ